MAQGVRITLIQWNGTRYHGDTSLVGIHSARDFQEVVCTALENLLVCATGEPEPDGAGRVLLQLEVYDARPMQQADLKLRADELIDRSNLHVNLHNKLGRDRYWLSDLDTEEG